MVMATKPLFTALVAFVTLSLSASAGIVPIEQHILARDPKLVTRQAGAESGKLATPVHVGAVTTGKQAILKLTGDDLHTPINPAAVEDAKISVPGGGKSDAALAAFAGGEKSHCYLGHVTANIKRIRYTMRVMIDRDESGATAVAGKESVKGAVVKATSGLYEKEDPMQGSCAKSLARHGEVCADRPYVVPQSALPPTSGQGAEQATYQAGPYKQKRDEPAIQDWHQADHAANVVFKRTAVGPLPGTTITATTVRAGHGEGVTPDGNTVCVDTVKRDQQVTKVVPTSAQKAAPPTDGSPLHFELVRSDAKSNIWNQVIYDPHGKPIDVTHLELTENMSFWRAEYFCATCPPGHQKHTVLYENVEIELHEDEEHKDKDKTPVPEMKCNGSAQSTNVHKREKSKYAHKNNSGVEYSGAIFSIDRVTLGAFDKNENGKVWQNTRGTLIGFTRPSGDQEPNKKSIRKRETDIKLIEGEPVF